MSEMKTHSVGSRIPRVDAKDKVTGHAIYGFDVDLPGMLYGATLRSPLPHAKIVEIETSGAKKAPGVRAVAEGRDFPFTFGTAIKDQPFLAVDRVRYVGEPVVAVAAETEAAAMDALQKIQVKYEELPAVFDPREALKDESPLVHPHLERYPHSGHPIVPGTNVCVLRTYKIGDMEKGFAEADEIFEDEFSAHPVSHATIEPHVAVAQYLPATNHYTIWSSTDRPYLLSRELAVALGIPADHIRYIVPYVGGAFGGKNTLVAEAIAVALARFTKGRPVKVVFSREEELTATQVRVGAFMKLKTGVKRDGTLTARSADIVWDSGAYISNSNGVAIRGAYTIFGPYRIPNVELVSRLVYTNKEISGSYRGYGTTQVTWACESQMDMIAHRLGIDPLELRLKNAYAEGDRYINGQVLHGVGLKETIEKAAQEIGWGKRGPSSPTTRRGKGMAVILKGTLTPTNSCCFIKVNQEARATVICTTPETGGGQRTVLSQIAADAIGLPVDSVVVTSPDTSITPYNDAVGSSRTTFHMGNAVLSAGQQVRRKILDLAGRALNADPHRLNLFEGKIYEEGVGERITLKALLSQTFGPAIDLLGEGFYTPAESPLLAADPNLEGWDARMSSIFWMFATHAVEVDVDTETGVVKIVKVAAAHDVGKAINPLTCEQQIEGSVIMGLSNTLFEELKMEGGRILNNSLADYKLATVSDMPRIVPILVEARHTEGPFGAKGVGEPAAGATGPAIANAIFDAVGVRIKDLPITAEKVWAALKRKEGRGG
ncbi:MAG TPA: xanthine dehydrogenase family protein molybdopterin-binding subunit [Thermodesulfobacteriota bacterium]|nr:xanthine dehydrogenase family protein molybdopterin-binding subunit [Thermodesulfobacteriota bacterium]